MLTMLGFSQTTTAIVVDAVHAQKKPVKGLWAFPLNWDLLVNAKAICAKPSTKMSMYSREFSFVVPMLAKSPV